MKHIAIIGGGVIGLSTAWYCVQRGHRVTVIDRNPNRRSGCSFGNAGMLVPSHIVPLAAPGAIGLGLKWMWNPKSPFYIKPRFSLDLVSWLWKFNQACTSRHVQQSAPLLRDLHFRSRDLYEQLESELPGGFGLQTHGLLMLCKTERGLDDEAETAKLANDLNVTAEVLDAAATGELDPGVQMDVVGSVYYPSDCHLSPNRLMSALQTELESRGCEFHWETETRGFKKTDLHVRALKTDQGDISADEFVLCGGVWSGELARDLDLSMPVQAGKGYSVTLDEPPELPTICSLLQEARVAVTPIGASLRVGGTMEMAGIDESITASRVSGITESFIQYFPAFKTADFAGPGTWSGLRPCSPDGLPYLGRSRVANNLTVSCGHAMMGISLALVSGEVVADLIDGNEMRIANSQLLSPDRYQR